SGSPGEAEARMRRHDGTYRWFLFRVNPVRDEVGNVTRWFGINTDIQRRKSTEEALRATERDLRLIIDSIPANIYVLDTDGSIQYISQGVVDYTGIRLEEVTEEYRSRVIHPEDLKRVIPRRAELLTRPLPFENEQRSRGKDGKYRWFLVRYKPLL